MTNSSIEHRVQSSTTTALAVIGLSVILIASISILPLSGTSFAQQDGQSLPPNYTDRDVDLEQTPFPPPVVTSQNRAPDYVITIPNTAAANASSTFDPAVTAVPVGTAVMWINSDTVDHTVTTAQQGQGGLSPPESFDSGVIPGKRGLVEPGAPTAGGSFIHAFDVPGVYAYACTIHPEHTGIVYVGDTVLTGQNGNIDLIVGADLPLDIAKIPRVVFAAVPTMAVEDLPPTLQITYQISISNPMGQEIYNTEFVDVDGVLYVGLDPEPAANETATTPSALRQSFLTWGPDLSGAATGPNTGAFHIRGPVLTQFNQPYTLQVAITAIDENILENPLTEQFMLQSQVPGGQQQ
jgi:plastocyanin